MAQGHGKCWNRNKPGNTDKSHARVEAKRSSDAVPRCSTHVTWTVHVGCTHNCTHDYLNCSWMTKQKYIKKKCKTNIIQGRGRLFPQIKMQETGSLAQWIHKNTVISRIHPVIEWYHCKPTNHNHCCLCDPVSCKPTNHNQCCLCDPVSYKPTNHDHCCLCDPVCDLPNRIWISPLSYS